MAAKDNHQALVFYDSFQPAIVVVNVKVKVLFGLVLHQHMLDPDF